MAETDKYHASLLWVQLNNVRGGGGFSFFFVWFLFCFIYFFLKIHFFCFNLETYSTTKFPCHQLLQPILLWSLSRIPAWVSLSCHWTSSHLPGDTQTRGHTHRHIHPPLSPASFAKCSTSCFAQTHIYLRCTHRPWTHNTHFFFFLPQRRLYLILRFNQTQLCVHHHTS